MMSTMTPDLQDDHGGIEAGAFVDALDQNEGDEEGEEGGGEVDHGAGRDDMTGGKLVIHGARQGRQNVPMPHADEVLKVTGPAVGHAGGADGILEE